MVQAFNEIFVSGAWYVTFLVLTGWAAIFLGTYIYGDHDHE